MLTFYIPKQRKWLPQHALGSHCKITNYFTYKLWPYTERCHAQLMPGPPKTMSHGLQVLPKNIKNEKHCRRLGARPLPGNRFVSFVRAYARCPLPSGNEPQT